MSPSMLRQFWSLVETIYSEIPLALDDNSLIQWLLRQMRARRLLTAEETDLLVHYIHDRLPLIRELEPIA
ncbi:MAG: hypothetical protein HC781_10570 [Leptolyngbyaceae cyanobacterium CSU_1_4]|nr:hypothetical protein [Leptolyngbyaceae cyanobacterium CSU_1_4]